MSEWLELELAEELRPAAAPDELWDRVCTASPRPAVAVRRSVPTVSWPVAAIVSMMIAAATLWLAAKGQEPVSNLEQLAEQQLHNPSPLDVESSDPAKIDGWVSRQTGVSLSLPSNGQARLVGARMVRTGRVPVAAVSYRVGGDTATLLVAQAGAAMGQAHGRLTCKSHGHAYALACSNVEHPEAACQLCHAKS